MSVTAAKGFEAAGLACGLKPSGASDLALVATATRTPVTAAGVFTTNLAKAAPVIVSREHLGDGTAAAVVLNSGNANAATGESGRRDARRMCTLAAEAIGCDPQAVLVCSTGLIGIPLPMDPIERGIPQFAGALRADEHGAIQAADAILTTDTVRKEVTMHVELAGGIRATIGGMAKGAAMLAPSMATMLAVITTDIAIAPGPLQVALTAATDASFGTLTVDGCRSTNDTVLVLAGGLAGNETIDQATGAAFDAFAEGLQAACYDLAEQMARDAEGATKFVRIEVCGARSIEDARRAARGVAQSELVKCSLYGEDPYWGRILSELGASGAIFDPEMTEIAYNATTVCRNGIAAPHDTAAVATTMKGREITITCDLHAGRAKATVLTTDLTHAYIDENMGTS